MGGSLFRSVLDPAGLMCPVIHRSVDIFIFILIRPLLILSLNY